VKHSTACSSNAANRSDEVGVTIARKRGREPCKHPGFAPEFIQQLWDIINDADKNCIYWLPCGSRFAVVKGAVKIEDDESVADCLRAAVPRAKKNVFSSFKVLLVVNTSNDILHFTEAIFLLIETGQ
jgi:hypothetical protein